MTIQLGVLLGQYGGGQSFEQVGSWSNATVQCSLSLQGTDVHSSGSGGRLAIFSGAAGALAYDYLQPDDALQRWCASATTHRIVAYGWGRLDSAAWSGQVSAALAGGVPLALGAASSLQPMHLEAQVGSGQGLSLAFQIASGHVGSASLYLDDLTVAADVLDLQADWSSAQQRQLSVQRHATLYGRQAAFTWHERPAFRLALPALPSSAAEQVNRWWREARTLLLVLDTMDPAQRWAVRLGNQSPPAAGPAAPYPDVFPATLVLEGLHGSLDF